MTIAPARRKSLVWAAGILLMMGVLYILPPGVQRADLHESAAAARLRMIAQRQNEFRTALRGGFAQALEQLQIGPTDGFYVYSLETTAKDGQGRITMYTAKASPATSGRAGLRYLSIDETGTLRYDTHPVDRTSPRVME